MRLRLLALLLCLGVCHGQEPRSEWTSATGSEIILEAHFDNPFANEARVVVVPMQGEVGEYIGCWESENRFFYDTPKSRFHGTLISKDEIVVIGEEGPKLRWQRRGAQLSCKLPSGPNRRMSFWRSPHRDLLIVSDDSAISILASWGAVATRWLDPPRVFECPGENVRGEFLKDGNLLWGAEVFERVTREQFATPREREEQVPDEVPMLRPVLFYEPVP